MMTGASEYDFDGDIELVLQARDRVHTIRRNIGVLKRKLKVAGHAAYRAPARVAAEIDSALNQYVAFVNMQREPQFAAQAEPLAAQAEFKLRGLLEQK